MSEASARPTMAGRSALRAALAGVLLAAPLPAAGESRLESSAQWLGAGGRAIATGDLGGDSKPDYVVAREGANGVFINQGGGDFTQVQGLGNGDTRGVAIGDVDNENGPDIVTANRNANVRVWVNDGTGQFTNTDNPTLSSPWSVALADFDGNGNLDIFLGTTGNTADRVLEGHGDGTFTDTGQTIGNTKARDVALGNFDDDGDTDIAVATGGGDKISIMENTGSNNLTLSQNHTISLAATEPDTTSIDAGNIDGDGLPELVMDNGSGEKCWADNDGAGNVTFTAKNPTTEPCGTLVDADGTNELDVVLPENGSNKVYTNNGSGSFSDTGQSLGSLNTSGITPIDADGDGDEDFLAVGKGLGVALWDNDDGDAKFTDPPSKSNPIRPFAKNPNGRAVGLGDIDGDGYRDAVVANYNAKNRVWTNDSSDPGLFRDAGLGTGLLNKTLALALGDLDGDGDPDVVTANDSSEGNRVNINNATGLNTNQTVGSNSSADVGLADLDNDGDRDAVFANLSTTGNTVYTNDGTGSLTDTGQTLKSQTSHAVALGDLDGDGYPDAVFGNDGTNNVYLGSISADLTKTTGLGSADTRGIALADTDGDGDLDIVAANDNAALQIWHNDGNAGFSEGPSLSVAQARAVAPIDLDGDGTQELYIARIGANRVAERSGGSWGLRSRKLGHEKTRDVAVGDVNDDSRPDVVTANNQAARRVWLNQDAGRIQLKQSSYSAAESDGTVTLKVERTGPAGTASIDYATQDGQAVAVDDYTSASGTLSWADGSASDKSVTIDLTSDGTKEPDEDFAFKLSNLAGSGSAPEPELGSPTEATIAIAGSNLAPSLGDKDVTTPVNEAVAVDVAASDPNGDSLSYTVNAKPAHGSVSLAGTTATYDPEDGYAGSDRFEVKVSDGQGGSVVAVVSITVSQGDNTAPEIHDVSLDLAKNESGTAELVANDRDGDSLSYSFAAWPDHGIPELSAVDEQVTYYPDPGYNGRDSFKIQVADGQGGTATATIRVEVGKIATSSGGGSSDSGGGCTLSRGNAAGAGPLWALLLLGPWAWQRRRRRPAQRA